MVRLKALSIFVIFISMVFSANTTIADFSPSEEEKAVLKEIASIEAKNMAELGIGRSFDTVEEAIENAYRDLIKKLSGEGPNFIISSPTAIVVHFFHGGRLDIFHGGRLDNPLPFRTYFVVRKGQQYAVLSYIVHNGGDGVLVVERGSDGIYTTVKGARPDLRMYNDDLQVNTLEGVRERYEVIRDIRSLVLDQTGEDLFEYISPLYGRNVYNNRVLKKQYREKGFTPSWMLEEDEKFYKLDLLNNPFFKGM